MQSSRYDNATLIQSNESAPGIACMGIQLRNGIVDLFPTPELLFLIDSYSMSKTGR